MLGFELRQSDRSTNLATTTAQGSKQNLSYLIDGACIYE